MNGVNLEMFVIISTGRLGLVCQGMVSTDHWFRSIETIHFYVGQHWLMLTCFEKLRPD